MNRIVEIYRTDLQRILKNGVAAVVILGLVILPSLYAWFNILASWDPYGNTKGLSVAVVSLDKGAVIENQPINAGSQIIDSLKENTSIGWIFTTREAAEEGVRRGKFYASIVIPENFSARIASVLTESPEQAEIIYEVNEKLNAVAPKITSKGASTIVEEVSRNFVETANGAIFKIFNQLGVELQEQLPLIERLTSLVTRLESRYPEINKAAQTAVKDLTASGTIIAKTESALPRAAELAEKGTKAAQSLSAFLEKNKPALASAAPSVKSALAVTQQAGAQTAAVAGELKSLPADQLAQNAAGRLQQNQSALSTASVAASGLSQLLMQLGGLDKGSTAAGILNQAAAKTASIQERLTSLQKLNQSLLTAAQQGKTIEPADLDRLETVSGEISTAAGDLLGRYDSEIQPAVLKLADEADAAAKQTAGLLNEAEQVLPQAAVILQDAAKAVKAGTEGARSLQKQLPAAEQKISELGSRLRSLEKEGDLQKLIDLLSLNFQQESRFFGEPVVLKEKKLFPIPNYGSGMSPFFTTLSLWVGGLLLVSLLSVEVDPLPGQKPYRSYEVYFGRYLTFATLAVLQSLFVTAGDILLLGTYAEEPVWFIVFGVFLSLIFMLMIYTLVSVFGNVGKAMAIVLLVLQLAGSGGTFPIQVTPPFFQAVYPFLPFTYAIRIMREAVGGMLWDVTGGSLLMLLLFGGSSLAIGVGLKEIINSKAARLVKKAKESRLIH